MDSINTTSSRLRCRRATPWGFFVIAGLGAATAGCGGHASSDSLNSGDSSTTDRGQGGGSEAGVNLDTSPSGHSGASSGLDGSAATADAATGMDTSTTESSASSGDGGGPSEDDVFVAGDVAVPGSPTVGADGYITLDAGAYVLVGYVASSVGGSSSSIALTYGSTSYCASGTVGANSTYQSWASTGFNVDQSRSATGGAASSMLLSASSITLTFANPAGSQLEIELLDSSYHYWCYDLTNAKSPVTIPLSSFNSMCWDNSGTPFVSGTAIQSINLNVPGSATATTPFHFCFLGLTIQPAADSGAPDAQAGVDAAAVDAGTE